MQTVDARSRLIEAMRQPHFYPEHPERVKLRQTHTSYVFLAGEYAYKVRKPITLAFIDCSTPARRRELCERELSLNRRLSPEVYCGVLPIIYRNSKYSFGGELTNADVVVDFCLKMHRLPDARRLDQLLESGSATMDDVRRIADHLAQFHANVSSDQAWNYGSAASVWQLVMGNLEEMANLATDMVMPDQLELIRSFSRRFITAHWEFFNQRARNRRIRDGHGDLRGDAIYLLSDGIRIVDALEFSERLRYADVASEIAFLAMDCDRLGHPKHARELARAYSLASDDTDLEVLLPFYKCYRATIRAKVELIKSRQEDCPPNDRALAHEQACRHLRLGSAYAEQSLTKRLLVVCGLSGTGKSTLARSLQQRTAFPVLSSDTERKRLAGVAATTRLTAAYGEGSYSADFSARVYQALVAQAEELLRSGQGVIIDATFQRRQERALISALGQGTGMAPMFIECRAPHDEVVRRLIERDRQASDVSDANVKIYLAQVAHFEPLDEIPSTHHVIVDTARDWSELLVELERRVFSF